MPDPVVCDAAPRDLGEPVEGQPKHRLAACGRGAEHPGDRFDRGVVVLGLDDDVEEFVPTFERTDKRVGDLPAFGFLHVVGHGVKPNHRGREEHKEPGRT